MIGETPEQKPTSVPRSLDPSGFTLVEMLVASVILVVALLGIAAVLPTMDMDLSEAGRSSKAVSLCQEMIEMIKNDPFTQLVSYNNVDTRNITTFPVDDPNPPIPGNAGNFMGGSNVSKWKNDIALYLSTGAGITGGYGTIRVASVASDSSGNDVLRKVSVVVFWTDGGRPHQIQLDALVSAI